jgi:ferrous iron transport protein B
MPAGALIWIVANVDVGGQSIAAWTVNGLDPLAFGFVICAVVAVGWRLFAR